MRHSIITRTFLLLVLIAFSNSFFSQAPEGVNYQAVIRNPLGIPLNNQAVNVRFTIHQSNITGTVVFQETHTTTSNQFGLVNLEIGSVNTIDFPLINWGIGTYFLQVEVDAGSGFDDLGATQLLSVPYALYAKTSGNGPQGLSSLMDTISAGASCPNGGYQVLMGLDANSNGVLDAGEVTSSFFVCNGSIGTSINWLGSFSTAPAGTTNDAYYNSTDGVSYIFNGATLIWDTLAAGGAGGPDADWTVVGNDMYSAPTGNVGIGTTTPTKKLSIESSFAGGDGIRINNTSAIGNPGLEFQTQGTSRFVLGVDQSDNNKFKIGVSSVNINTRFTIDNQGKVGIGLISPIHQLSVSSTDSIIASFIGTNPNVSVISVAGVNPNAATGAVFLTGADSGIIAMDPSQKTFFLSNSTPNGHVSILADSSVALYGQVIGNVSDKMVNQTDTIYSLSSSGTILNVNQGTFITDSLYKLGNNSGVPNWVLANDGFGQAVWTDPSTLISGSSLWQSNTPDIYFNTGNVGIGTITPSSALEVNGGITVSDGTFGTPSYVYAGTQTGFFRGVAGGERIEFLTGGLTSLQIYQNQLRVKRGNLAAPGVVWSDETATGIFGPGSNEIAFVNNGTESVRIDAVGNVGIGTNNPQQLFTLSTPGSTTLRMERTNAAAFDWEMNVDNLGFHLKGGADGVGPALTDYVNVDGFGNMGLGIAAPTQLLHLYGGTLRIDDGVKPYNLPPSDGTISGQVMTTDGAGNVTWQTPVAASPWTDGGTDIFPTTLSDNVAIGVITATNSKLQIDNSTEANGATINTWNSANASVYGLNTNVNSTSTNQYGLYSIVNSISPTSFKYGFFTTVSNAGNTNYGIYSEVNGATINWSAYFADGNVYVADTIVIPTGAAAGFVLTSDPLGNATWQAPAGGGAWTSNGTETYLNSINDNVGIGTTTPSSILHIMDNVSLTPEVLLETTAGNFNIGYRYKTALSEWFMGQGNGTGQQFRIEDKTTGTVPFVIDQTTGNIGAGTISPLVQMHIADEAQTILAVQSSHNGLPSDGSNLTLLRSRGTIAAPTNVIAGDRLGKVEFVGYNSVTYTEVASIRAVADETYGSTNNGTHLEFHTSPIGGGSSVEVLRISDNGSVGIGTPTPNANLDVTGTTETDNLRVITGSGTAGDVLTSDALGNATWQAPSGGAPKWDLLGNAGTVDGTNFIGTTDNVPLNFRVNNQPSGRIDPTLSNVFFGDASGANIGGGSLNTYYGSYSGFNNTTGNTNTFIGGSAGFNNVSGSANTMVGYYAGYSTTGSFNTFIGEQAAVNNSGGSFNSFLGRDAGQQNTSGANNTFLGFQAGLTNTIGNSNVIIGYNANVSSNNLTNAIAIGANAVVGTSNSLILGDNSVNVGIGTSAPNSKLNVVNGVGLDLLNLEGSGFSGGGLHFVYVNNTIGYELRADDTGGMNLNASGFNKISFETNGSEKMRISGAGDVGIGTTTPTARLDVAGTFKLKDGTEGMGKILTSDATGNASWKENQIAFFIGNDGSGSYDQPITVAPVDLLFGNVGSANFVIGGGMNPATSRFTAPVSGVYHFDANTNVVGPGGQYIVMRLNVNGVDVVIWQENIDGPAGARNNPHVSGTVHLNANDVVKIQISGDLGAGNVIGQASAFSGHLVFAD